MTKKSPSEGRIQYEVVQWLQSEGIFFFSVPNEGAGGNVRMMTKLVSMGLRAGASDLVIVLQGRVIFLELKDDEGVQSKLQKVFQDRVEGLGHTYWLCRSLDEVKENFLTIPY